MSSKDPLWDWTHNAASNLLFCAMNETDMKKAVRYVAIALVWTSEVNVLFEQALYTFQQMKQSIEGLSKKIKSPPSLPEPSSTKETICRIRLERSYHYLFLAFKLMLTGYNNHSYKQINKVAADTHFKPALDEINAILQDPVLKTHADQIYRVANDEDILERKRDQNKITVITGSGMGVILRDVWPYKFNQFASHLIRHRYEYHERGLTSTMDYETILEDPTNIKFYKQALELDPGNYYAAKRIANFCDSTEKNLEGYFYFSMAENNMPYDDIERPMIIYKRGCAWISAFEQDKDNAIRAVTDILKEIGSKGLKDITIKDLVKVIKYFIERAKQAETCTEPVPVDFSGKTYLEGAAANYARIKQDTILGIKEIKQSKHCLTCNKPGTEVKLKMCTTCHVATYCSRECQVADWPKHKKVCKKPGPDDKQHIVVVNQDGYRIEMKSENEITGKK
ncbi:hypothetical protein AKO1_001785 [Acrasis kona]|uniref:MYND-type domain-containing protein n=1 Tax=Acrasis kona TaxID=1008807 RepID=A0AAW2ZA03_9EUKA